MIQIENFAEIEAEFMQRVTNMVYCNCATVDAHGRPRSRVIHPIWQGAVGWFTTDPKTAKAKQLTTNPFMSLAYVADPFKPVYVECRATWQNDRDTRHFLWDLCLQTPPPMGYDPALVWEGVDSPGYAVLRLEPWRIELYDLRVQANRKVWYAEPVAAR